MGNKTSAFDDDQLEEYQVCTFLSRKDIFKAYRMFSKLTGAKFRTPVTREEAATNKVKFSALEKLPELRENPFRRRMCEVFSSEKDASLSFDEFLEMFSVFSELCPREIKAAYAFKIFDFDNDNFIGSDDLTEALKHLSHDLLQQDEIASIVTKILDETDIDCDDRLSQSEFTHSILKSPDFVANFHIRI